ncbi:MAG: alpha/beta-type small acid-soluble spore protein [Clostridia bacterium]|nr:alpha/beta-type small acid-soluble spore protein [Clostridia bacterium]
MKGGNVTPLPTRQERLKYEVARDLGLMPKVLEVGWPGLTTAESGRVGGIVARRLREDANTKV